MIDPASGMMHSRAVGQRAVDIAKVVGMQVAPIAGVGREHPLSAPFLDLRKRVVEYPSEAQRAVRSRLVAISTTSGTGTEVTPFAVMLDDERLGAGQVHAVAQLPRLRRAQEVRPD